MNTENTTMTQAQQPEALRMADALEKYSLNSLLSPLMELAAELRRQHARIEELEAQLSAIGAGGVEPLRKQAAPAALAVPMAEAWEQSAADTEHQRTGAGLHFNQGVADGLRICAKDLRDAIAATPAADAPMVDMTPPATSRDRWMYEQGRLAERDARTPGSVAAAAPVVLPEPDAYLYTSGNHRGVSLEWRGQSDMAEGTERHALYTERQVRALLGGVFAPAAQGMNAPNEWEDIRTLPTCDDLIWLYCQDSNTIDGPIAPEPNLEEYGWSHWAYANAPSTVWIDAALAAQAKQGEQANG